MSCGCYSQKLKRGRNGKNHPNWNPNLTKEERLENKNRSKNPKYRKWHNRVLQRDWFKCQCCKTPNKNLEVHHIYSWHSHKHLRHTTSNGVTLCKNCHKKFHKIYGRKFNTKKQLSKFLKEYHHVQ